MKPIHALFLAALAASTALAEPPMSGGVGSTLSWQGKKETKTPEPEYTKRGGIAGTSER